MLKIIGIEAGLSKYGLKELKGFVLCDLCKFDVNKPATCYSVPMIDGRMQFKYEGSDWIFHRFKRKEIEDCNRRDKILNRDLEGVERYNQSRGEQDQRD